MSQSILTYAQEVRARRRNDTIFWLVTTVFACFLYLFFQGYYVNYRQIFTHAPDAKQTFLKPFGIIDIHAVPSPDGMIINNAPYNNNSKTIFDLGNYTASIWKEGYINLDFPIAITRENPFYASLVNLIREPKYRLFDYSFDTMHRADGALFVTSGSGKELTTLSSNYEPLQKTITTLMPFQNEYFLSGSVLNRFNTSTDTFIPVTDRDGKTKASCTKWETHAEIPYCPTFGKFYGPNAPDTIEKFIFVGNSIGQTRDTLWNLKQDGNWQSYPYTNPLITHPKSLFHIAKIPYVLQDGKILELDVPNSIIETYPFLSFLDTLENTIEVGSDTVLLGRKDGQNRAIVFEREKHFIFELPNESLSDIKINAWNGVYVITSKKSAYIYYKGARNIFQVLSSVDILYARDSIVFFRKDGYRYMLDLGRTE